MKNVLETNKLEVRFYESWGNKKLEWAFKNDYDIKIIVSGADKIHDVNVFEYKKDGKKVASIKVIFNTRTVEGVTFLQALKIVGGYSYKKYMDELLKEINEFVTSLTLDCYNKTDLIKRGKGIHICGIDYFSQNKHLKKLVINENIELSPTLKLFRNRQEVSVFEYNNVLYEKGHLYDLQTFLNSSLFSEIDTLHMIINNDDIYYGIGEKI